MTHVNLLCIIRYHVPSHLSEHINFISPGVGLGVSTPRPNKRNELRRRGDSSCPPSPGASDTSLENCWLSASPQCYNALYNIPKLTDPHPNNSFGIFEVDVSYIQSDMDKFFEQVAPEIPVGTVPKQFLLNDAILSTNLTSLGQVEADLDFQVAWPLVYPQKLTLFESNLTQTQVTSILTSGLNISSPTAASIFVSFAVEDLLGSIDAVGFHYEGISIKSSPPLPGDVPASFSGARRPLGWLPRAVVGTSGGSPRCPGGGAET